MIPFWKKTGKHSKPQSVQKRRQNAKPAVPRTAQQSIPMQRMFEDGTCRVKPNYYTRTIQYQDINYQLAQQEDKTAIFEEWCSFLNFFDSSIKFELSFVNMATALTPPTNEEDCIMAVNDLNGYQSGEGLGIWHTAEASLAHEEHHPSPTHFIKQIKIALGKL